MSWLRRLVTTKSTWKSLHMEEVVNNVFNPTNSTMENLEAARNKINNPVWKDIYAAPLKCGQNMMTVNPEEYAKLPINGETDITDNHCGIQQHW